MLFLIILCFKIIHIGFSQLEFVFGWWLGRLFGLGSLLRIFGSFSWSWSLTFLVFVLFSVSHQVSLGIIELLLSFTTDWLFLSLVLNLSVAILILGLSLSVVSSSLLLIVGISGLSSVSVRLLVFLLILSGSISLLLVLLFLGVLLLIFFSLFRFNL